MPVASVSEAADAPRLGFYGKLPARGDFLARRLPREFIEPWDEWAQEAIAASREQLGDDWLPRYLQAPLWRFVIAPGLCGAAASAGVMMASVDRVGRYFPLVLAVPIGTEGAPLSAMQGAASWFEDVEELALTALAEDFDLASFDAAVALVGAPPAGVPLEARRSGCGLALPLGADGSLASRAPAIADRLLADSAAGYSLWWTSGSPEFPAAAVVAAGLPSPAGFAALLDGAWERWGWTTR